jgi:hypothetical protein
VVAGTLDSVPAALRGLCVAAHDPAATLVSRSGLGNGARVAGDVLMTQHGRQPSSLRCVIRAEREWQSAWPALVLGFAPETPPSVDFARFTVVVATLGELGGSGPLVGIDSVFPSPGGAAVRVNAIDTGAGCGEGDLITRPMDVVTIPRVSGEVRFLEHRSRGAPCE